MSKEEWRKTLLAARRQMSEAQRESETHATLAHVREYLTAYPQAAVAIYMPIFGELSPLALLDTVPVACVPVIEEDGTMRFARMDTNTTTHSNRFGIAEPVTPEWVTPTLIFTPLVGVDTHGTRLGYGKGYYDRYFASDAGKNAQRIGLAFHCQCVEALPSEPHDLPLHTVITADGVTAYA
jgi:5-formyltetrahydrofolate cyclo-ligase